MNQDKQTKTRKKLYQPLLTNETGKLQPQSVELEEAVLGAILLEKDAFDTVVGFLKSEHFYKEQNQLIYKAVLELASKNEPIDLITVCQQLKRSLNLEMVGGSFYVSSLTSRIASSSHIESHARIVVQKALLREMILISTQSINKAYEEDTDCFDLIEWQASEISNLENGLDGNQCKTIEQLKNEVIENCKDVLFNDKVSGVPISINSLQRVTNGWRNGNLIVLAARPGMGKTAVALEYAMYPAMLGIPVGMFSLEMSALELTGRLMSKNSGISSQKINNNTTNTDELSAVIRDSVSFDKVPFYIDDTPALSITRLRAKAHKMKREKGIKMLIIDYLQLMDGAEDGNGNREQEISKITRGLKKLAKELDLPIIVLSQLSRQVENRPGGVKIPQLSDLRDSGCLSADTLISCPNLRRNVKIIDLVNNKDFYVSATDEKYNRVLKAKKCFKSGEKEVFEMTLSNGQKIKATSDHKFLTENGWKELKDLENERVAVPIDFDNYIKDEINENEIELLGHFIANGSAIKHQPIRYAFNLLDEDLGERVMNCAKLATNNQVVPRIEKTITEKRKYGTAFFKPAFHCTHGKTSPVGDIMRKYNLFDVRSKQKFIPDELFFLNHINTAILLKALFSGDGNAYYAEKGGRKTLKVSYSSGSEKLIIGVQHLLAKIGIVSFVIRSSNAKNQVRYNVYVAGKSNTERFVEKVGFFSKRKQDIMINGWDKCKNTLAGWTTYKFNDERTLCFMPVKSILSKGVEDVYDIEVPKLHNFMANGMIVHNCIEQDADMVIFLYRPEYYGFDTHEHKGVNMPTEQLMVKIIAKFRGGAPGDILARWIGETTSIANWDNSKPGDANKKLDEPAIESKAIQDNTSFLNESPITNIITVPIITKSHENNEEPFF